jgi:uncharacterized membrane protein (DUF2068 family)
MKSEQPTLRAKPKTRVTGLRVIALIKIAKALLLTGLAFGFFRSINQDLGDTVRLITLHLRIDPENSFVRLILEKITNVDPHTLRTIGLITFVYAGELYVEGVGLWLNQAWAEYLLILATGGFLPWEARSCIVNFSWERLVLILLNLIALLYVIWVIWYQKHPRQDQAG